MLRSESWESSTAPESLVVQQPFRTQMQGVHRLQEQLFTTRAATFALIEGLGREQFCCQADPDFSPVGWHLGHIAFTEGLWILEHSAGLPRFAPEFGCLFAVDGLPKAQRTALPPTGDIYDYVRAIRSQVLAWLASYPHSVEPRLWQFLIQHESQHAETMGWVRQLLCGTKQEAPIAAGVDTDEMIRVEAGEVLIGSDAPEALDNERPAHRRYVDSYWIDRYPVTQRQFERFIRAGGYRERHWWSPRGWQWLLSHPVRSPLYWSGADDRPVMGVSFFEAEAYARFAGKRLPTEAEWEKAARFDPLSGQSRTYPWGEAFPDGSRLPLTCGTTAVGSYPRGQSAVGCEDMLGNVWEWTATCFYPYQGFVSYPYPGYSAPYFDDAHYVLKGGSWATGSSVLRASFRNWYEPRLRVPFAGFRCARSL
ncbi:ergothioneine biosynthesis protein EgtB [Gloeobacter kilaueensis]|uniref:Ergothioneine biosynthesis protein EgtB n=1 Tax=Gloeobacter kilaueensis (strain ATCC BAA-2537 / CCAP 1431/1 / ULC 316 / JS1) TaxID=1183438 RepID=U5QSF0_GLOK1|nr:ergothioneine biosynthesis protein EgtB [Gloeobacter kilaueensis]AGY60660.1 hypothetical protein GKIL_4414 [Gloeobacter kilaueensis JS1]